MSTIDRVRQQIQEEQPKRTSAKGLRIAIAVAEWNREVTFALLEGAKQTLIQAGVLEDDIHIMYVPGAFELTNAAARLSATGFYHSVIVIGCVVRGDTPHFDYVCQGVTQGISLLNAQQHARSLPIPIIFCVLTTDTMAQALDRAGGELGNKGSEAAETAIDMCRPRVENASGKRLNSEVFEARRS